jgi:hypothetical protein
MKHSIKMNDFNSYYNRGSLTALQQYEPGNFFFIVTNFDAGQKEIKTPIRKGRLCFSSDNFLSEVTAFDSEPTQALNILSNVQSFIEDNDFPDIFDFYPKPIPTNQFKVKAKIKSVKRTIPKIPPIEDYLL